MSQRDRLLEVVSLALASASMAVSASSAQAAPQATPQPAAAPVECFGINTCKGTNACAVGKAQIKVANDAYANKFAKSGVADCSGTTECAAKSGHLAWIGKASNDVCFKEGGFVFEKNAKGDFVIRDKGGLKKAKA